MDIILIIGLPGSGKTNFAHEMKVPGSVIIDDIVSFDQLPDMAEELIITDVNFCDHRILEEAKTKLREKYDDVEFEIIYFENDAERARKNVEYRNDGRNVEGTIRRFETIYNPPETALHIWQHDE